MNDIARWIEQLRDANPERRYAATERLVAIGADAVPALIAALNHPSFFVQRRAALALGRIGDSRGVVPLLRLSQRVGLDRDLREAVTEALDHFAANMPLWDDVKLLHLLETLHRERALHRSSNLYHALLGQLQERADRLSLRERETAIRLLESLEDHVRYNMAQEERRVQTLAALSPVQPKPPRIAPPPKQPAESKRQFHTTDIPFLVRQLRDTRYSKRAEATAALIQLGTDAVPPLIQALTENSFLLHVRAAEALGEIGDTRALLPLAVLYEKSVHHSEMDVISVAGNALLMVLKRAEKIADAHLVPALIEALRTLRPLYGGGQGFVLAEAVARALMAVARTNPVPELRAALPLLRSSLTYLLPSRTLREARRTIEQATAEWRNLPVTAAAPPMTADDLPVPAVGTDPNADELPRPASEASDK